MWTFQSWNHTWKIWQTKKVWRIPLWSDWILLFISDWLSDTLEHLLCKPPLQSRPKGWERKTFYYALMAETDFPVTFTKRESSTVTWPYWVAQVGCDSIALSSITTSIYLHSFYSTHSPVSQQGTTVSNTKNCWLFSRGIGKIWMMELVFIYRFFQLYNADQS